MATAQPPDMWETILTYAQIFFEGPTVEAADGDEAE